MAETFTDIEAFEGTCYKAASWQPCGITKGFTREHRADYFFRNDRPKKLWLRVLHRNAGPMLCGIGMPSQYAAGLNLNSPERALPLRARQLESLAILRVAPISVKFRQGVSLSWPGIFEQCAHSSVQAFSLINRKSIK